MKNKTPYPHTCLSCGRKIGDGEDAELVPGAGHRHRDYTGCETALRRPGPLDYFTAPRRDETGVVYPLPSLSEQEGEDE